MKPVRVLIVDDQELFASGLEIIIQGHGEKQIEVIGTAPDGAEAVRMAGDLHPDVILMDVRMPGMDGVEATRIVRERFPDIKILILTTFDDDEYVLDALRNGALGYILKDIRPDDLVTSIMAVSQGNFFVSQSVGVKLVQHAASAPSDSGPTDYRYQGEVNFLMSRLESLSRREAEILHLLLQDLSNDEIAAALFIAEQTVKNHISAIYTKLGVDDRVHAKKTAKERLAQKQ